MPSKSQGAQGDSVPLTSFTATISPSFTVIALRAGKLTGQDIGRESEFGKWLIWARAQADRLDPLVKSPPSILDTEPAPGPPVETRKSFAEIMNSLYER